MTHPLNDAPTPPSPSTSDPGSPTTRLIALIATTLVVLLVVWMQAAARNAPYLASTTTVDPPGAVVQLIGRYSVGAAKLLPAQDQQLAEPLTEQMDDSFGADPADALRVAIVKAELLSATAAIDHLTVLLEREDIPEPVRADADILLRLYSDGTTALTPEERTALSDHHDWFGRLALSHSLPDSNPTRASALSDAKRTAIVLFLALGAAGLLLILGIIALIILLTQRLSGKLPFTYHPATPGGSVYLEAFAIFLLGFLAIALASDLLTSATGLELTPLLIWLLALIPFYPLLRGQTWAKHRYALGFHKGKGLFREISAGILGYLAGLPVFLIGILCTLLFAVIHSALTSAAGQPAGPPPSHPLVDTVGSGGILGILIIYSMVSVWAPFVEESMFRGCFYHHLRARYRPFLSAFLVAFVFAVIHPPGIIAVPALMSLAIVFAYIREWRGSIIGCVTAHALHNGAIITTLLLMLA